MNSVVSAATTYTIRCCHSFGTVLIHFICDSHLIDCLPQGLTMIRVETEMKHVPSLPAIQQSSVCFSFRFKRQGVSWSRLRGACSSYSFQYIEWGVVGSKGLVHKNSWESDINCGWFVEKQYTFLWRKRIEEAFFRGKCCVTILRQQKMHPSFAALLTSICAHFSVYMVYTWRPGIINKDLISCKRAQIM